MHDYPLLNVQTVYHKCKYLNRKFSSGLWATSRIHLLNFEVGKIQGVYKVKPKTL